MEKMLDIFWDIVFWGITTFTVVMLICVVLLSYEGPVKVDTTPVGEKSKWKYMGNNTWHAENPARFMLDCVDEEGK